MQPLSELTFQSDADALVIGIAGPARAGKDTLIDGMLSRLNALPNALLPYAVRDQWAGPLKRHVSRTFGFSWEDVNGDGIDRDTPLVTLGGSTIRHVLQTIGAAYRAIDENWWANKMALRLRAHHASGATVVFISGTRYLNEAVLCDEVWWVERPGHPGIQSTHESETSLDVSVAHRVLRNDGTPADLCRKGADALTAALLQRGRRGR